METETAELLSSLDAQRNHVLGILDGLSDDALRKPVLPSRWSCLGLVQHLALDIERFWFRVVVASEQIDPVESGDDDAGDGWRLGPDASTGEVLDLYRREIEIANTVIEATPLDSPPAAWPTDRWPNWRLPDLRTVVLHVITETACHAGHLDVVRELLDGRTWMIV
jgi:hypothetical protein